MNLKNLFDNCQSLYNVFLFLITTQDEKKLQYLCQCFGQQQQFVRHLPFKLWQSMALILHIFLILLQVFFHYNFVKIVVETMIIKDDFFGIDCIKWWCYHVHLEDWITIVITTTTCATNGDWKSIGLMGKLCGAISPC